MAENKDYNLGKARISIHYDEKRSLLSITIHEAKSLINTDKKGLTDPYAVVSLLPDGKKETEKSTKVIKDNLNPVWNQTLDYTTTFSEASSRVLYVKFLDEKGLFERQETVNLGEITIPLVDLNIKQPVTGWWFLQPNSTFATQVMKNTNKLLVK